MPDGSPPHAIERLYAGAERTRAAPARSLIDDGSRGGADTLCPGVQADQIHRPRLAQLRAEWRTKLWLGTLLTIVFCSIYFAAQRFAFRTPIELRPTLLDRAIPFDPRWTLAYQSLYAMLALAWLAPTRDALRRYAHGLLLIAAIGGAIFFLVPTRIARPPVPADAGGAYRLLVSFDATTNCFPSEHIALATYSVAFAAVTLGPRRRLMIVALIAWATLIAYATLATRQHYIIDVIAGAILGLAGHAFAQRGRR